MGDKSSDMEARRIMLASEQGEPLKLLGLTGDREEDVGGSKS